MDNRYGIDWAAAMSRFPCDERYRSLEGLNKSAEDGNEFLRARVAAAKRLSDYVDENQLQSQDIVEATGCQKSLMSHMRAGRRPFCVPVKSWESLCYRWMKISVHDLMFGERRDLTLPKKYGVPAAYMQERLPESSRQKLLRNSRMIYEDYCSETVDDYGHRRPMAELIKERIIDIAKDDNGFMNYHIFGSPLDKEGEVTPRSMKSSLTAFWNGPVEPKSSFLMYAALCYKDQNLDYLVSENPINAYTDTYAISAEGKKVLITGDTLKFWSIVLSVDEERRQRLLEMVWTNIFSEIL